MSLDTYYDAGFQPSIRKLITPEDQYGAYIESWRFNVLGIPFPTNNGRKGAYWAGEFNIDGEAPILAVTTAPYASIKVVSTNKWFTGIANIKDVIEVQNDPHELPLYYADNANYSVANSLSAFIFLKNVLPIEVAPALET
jgi:hypothetical protein